MARTWTLSELCNFTNLLSIFFAAKAIVMLWSHNTVIGVARVSIVLSFAPYLVTHDPAPHEATIRGRGGGRYVRGIRT